jgi:surface polysaccharide O-acyltransferase-like enzyme
MVLLACGNPWRVSVWLICVWQTILEIKTRENKNIKKQKFENNLYMHVSETVVDVFTLVFFIFLPLSRERLSI